jgi:hypothetical protein
VIQSCAPTLTPINRLCALKRARSEVRFLVDAMGHVEARFPWYWHSRRKSWRLRLENRKLWQRGILDAMKMKLHMLLYCYGLLGDVLVHSGIHVCQVFSDWLQRPRQAGAVGPEDFILVVLLQYRASLDLEDETPMSNILLLYMTIALLKVLFCWAFEWAKSWCITLPLITNTKWTQGSVFYKIESVDRRLGSWHQMEEFEKHVALRIGFSLLAISKMNTTSVHCSSDIFFLLSNQNNKGQCYDNWVKLTLEFNQSSHQISLALSSPFSPCQLNFITNEYKISTV